MKEYWINKKNNKDLIVFFAGWGMDQNPFLPLKYNDLDILICYDYSDMNLNDLSIMDIIENGNYKNIYLIGFSMGVAVAGYLFQSELCIKFRQIIAINGTLEPISDENGIPVNIFENTLESWDSANKEHFLKRMCRDEIICSKYRINLPKRTLQDEKKELTNLHL
ncbi:MAG: DUF452 family protein, partial [Candidatus Delongbacteria bacterium]|nr:DUF452 family protein [Candidatus Delongbacteria bacterium]